MDIRELKTFVAVADAESFTRAGMKLDISQSAVSQHVRALETEIGSALFNRSGRSKRSVGLTQAGDVLLPYAKQILAKVDEALAVVSDYEAAGRGRVAIGAGGAVCHHILPAVLREFRSRFGRVEVQVRSGFTNETLGRTIEGTVDIGILVLPIKKSNIATITLGRDELVAIAPPGHAWESLERVQATDIAGDRLVVYERNSQTFHIIERFLLEQGVFPSFGMEIDDIEAVKKMVEAGLGVAVVPSWSVRAETSSGKLLARPLGNTGLFRNWGLAQRRDELLTASQRGLIATCKNMFPDLLAASRSSDGPR